MNEIITAVVSAGSAILICIISNHYQARATRDLIAYRLQELERKVDKHNNLVERTYELEGQTNLLKEQIKELKKEAG